MLSVDLGKNTWYAYLASNFFLIVKIPVLYDLARVIGLSCISIFILALCYDAYYWAIREAQKR